MFYDNLKAECERQGVKITPIVLQCGGNKGSLNGWRNGASPNSDIVAKLAVHLNVSTDVLIFGREPKINDLNADELEQTKIKNVDNKEQMKEESSFENINNGSTYYGTANIAVGNGIKQNNLNMEDRQSSGKSDTYKIVQELDEMMHSLNDEVQREALATQVRSNIQTFKLLLGDSKKKQN